MDEPQKSKSSMWILVSVSAGALMFCCLPGAMISLLWPDIQKIREKASRTQRNLDLTHLSSTLRMHFDRHKRMPANLDELQPFIGEKRIVELVRSGEIEIVWSAVSYREEERGAASVLIAWDARPDSSGQRQVVFMDGQVKTLDDEQFQKTPRVRKVGEKVEKKQ